MPGLRVPCCYGRWRMPPACRRQSYRTRSEGVKRATPAKQAGSSSVSLNLSISAITSWSQFSMHILGGCIKLLSASFYDSSSSTNSTAPLRPIFYHFYGFSVMMRILVTMFVAHGNAAFILAEHKPGQSAPGNAASVECDHRVLGMGTVRLVRLDEKMADSLTVPSGTLVALVANVAVQPALRGQGIARLLMDGCERMAVETFKPAPCSLVLLVYRDNLPAISLYRALGFEECARWVDPAWLEDAEKGRLGNPRRLLLSKALPGAV